MFIKTDLSRQLDPKPVGKINFKVRGFLKDRENQDYNAVNFAVKIVRQYFRIQDLEMDKLP